MKFLQLTSEYYFEFPAVTKQVYQALNSSATVWAQTVCEFRCDLFLFNLKSLCPSLAQIVWIFKFRTKLKHCTEWSTILVRLF